MGLKKLFKKSVGAVAGVAGITAAPIAKALRTKKSGTAPDDSGQLGSIAELEQLRRQELAEQQRKQIYDFADEYKSRAKSYRDELAKSLADIGQQTFYQANPFILEDLNSRGLFTSGSAVNERQADALKNIALANQEKLSAFDTNAYADEQDIYGSGLETYLGGNQDALDAALELRRAQIQRKFDIASQNQQADLAQNLARRQSRDQLLSSLIGFGGALARGGR